MKAKTKFTRLWSILLALVMVVGMLPTVALAAEPAADFTSGDGSAALALLNAAMTGTEASTWDSSTKTLTLKGVNFETSAATAVKLPDGAEIVLKGDNTIKGGNSESDDCYGIYGAGDLTIQGTGTLNVTGGTATNGSSYGIYAEANVSITGGTVEATGGEADEYSCGIEAEANVSITDGTVEATGGATNEDNSYGIYGDNVTISGTANVTANGGTASRYSLGIYASKNVTISDNADVTAAGGSATNSDSNGICADSNVTITGGTVKATAGTANSWSVGISADSCAVSISGGTVETTGGTAGEDSYGIYAYDNVTISGGTVTAEAGVAPTASALSKGPSELPGAYQWRTSESDDYTQSSDSAYSFDSHDLPRTYLEIKEQYTVTVTNGTASVSKAAAGTTVTLKANDAPIGQVFDKWVVVSGGITLADANSANTTFTMPAGNVTVTATYKDAPHTHSYGSEWETDASNHWHECTADGCDVTNDADKNGYGEHVYDNDADKTCNTCGYERTVTPPAHEHICGDWQSNRLYHWKVCATCGEKVDKARHDYGTDRTCDICGYVKPRINNSTTPSQPTDTTTKSADTGDMGIALYAGMTILSLTGGAWVVNKKRKGK